MKHERVILWVAAMAVFVIGNPFPQGAVLDQRAWMEIVFTYAGVSAALTALAGNLALAAAAVWAVGVALLHRSPDSLQTMVMIVCGLGLYRLAIRAGATRPLLRAIVALNIAALGLQAAGLFDPLMHFFFAGYSRVIHNPARVLDGLTPSTADLGCLLAISLPFFSGWWALPVALALVATQASSAIVAGAVGLVVLYWHRVRREDDNRAFALAFLGLLALGLVVNFVDGIESVIRDDRWRAWGITLREWWAGPAQEMLLGHGWGSWGVGLVKGAHSADLFEQAHFDALQLLWEAGAVGLALAVAAFAWFWRESRSRVGLAALAALAVAQFGHFPFHLASTGVVIPLVLAEASGE